VGWRKIYFALYMCFSLKYILTYFSVFLVLGTVAQPFNPSTVEAGGFLQVQVHPGLQSESRATQRSPVSKNQFICVCMCVCGVYACMYIFFSFRFVISCL
jgi:hypothetical protein